MLFSDAVTRVADECRLNSTITAVKSRIQREINRSGSEIWNSFRWSFRWRNYRIVTDTDVTAGTISAIHGTTDLIGSGTTFLSSYDGWHINFPADSISNWYKIRRYSSATTMAMDVPYQGTTGSGKSYILRHFDYLLPTEAWDLGSVMVTNGRRPLTILEPTSIDIIAPVPFSNGYPQAAAIYSSDSLHHDGPTSYSTGTISGSLGGTIFQVVSGTTAWLTNIFPGDILTVSGDKYTVASVDADTQVTVYQKLTAAYSSQAYTIVRQFGRYMRLMWPSIDNYTIDIRALRIYQDLTNDSDTNELLYRMPNTIIQKAAALELKSQGDQNWRAVEEQAERALSKNKSEDDALTIRDSVQGIYSYRQGPGKHYRESYR